MPVFRISAIAGETVIHRSFSCAAYDDIVFTVDDVQIPFNVHDNRLMLVPNENVLFRWDNADVDQPVFLPSPAFLAAGDFATGKRVQLFAETMDGLRMRKYRLKPGAQLTVGRDEEASVRFLNPYVSGVHIILNVLSEGRCELQDTSKFGGVFVNGHLVGSASLDIGDIIFFWGLTMVYGGECLSILPSAYPISCHGIEDYDEKRTTSEQAVSASPEISFTRSARVVNKLEICTRKIDPPPGRRAEQRLPLMYMIGPSLTMGFGTLMNLSFNIGNAISQGRSLTSLGGTLGMSASMMASAMLWPILNKRFQKKQMQEDENYRIQRYTAYIQEQSALLERYAAYNRRIQLENMPTPEELAEHVHRRDDRMWERMASDDDFLRVRLGLGRVPSFVTVEAGEEHFSLEDDDLRYEPQKLREAFSYMDDMPIELNLREKRVVGLYGSRDRLLEAVSSMTAQLAALHSYEDLRLVFIVPPALSKALSWAKLLPHCWSTNRKLRFFAVTDEEVHDVLVALDSELRERQAGEELPHYVFMVLSPERVAKSPIMRLLTGRENKIGVTALFISETKRMLPPECSIIIQNDENGANLYDALKEKERLTAFAPEHISGDAMLSMCESLSCVNIKDVGGQNGSLPDAVTYLDLYRVGKVEQLGVADRWRRNHAAKSIGALIGVRAGGELFTLDLHEKLHGPHGLIAGMTGSGKSEFIQSMLLSLAINYHPDEVSFVLIDYKGGGMANVFSNSNYALPHVAGKITDIDGNQIQRSLYSLRAEIERRKQIFARLQIQNINDYHKLRDRGEVREPLPHLLVVADEFAELQSNQPDFMAELKSAARVGRTLGIHLILATQKPSGVVNDQIWANSRFHICLKVQDRQDSMEMLHHPDAGRVTQPGRCFIQVGYDEIFEQVQSGYSGAPYVPREEYIDPELQTVTLIDNAARMLRSQTGEEKAPKEGTCSQLEAIVRHIDVVGKVCGVTPYRLWLEPLGDLLPLESIPAYTRRVTYSEAGWKPTQNENWMNIVVGMIDDPSRQAQYPLELNFAQKGSIVLYGMPVSGKSTFVQTLVASIAATHSPDDCQITWFDFGGNTTRCFNALPHCAGNIFHQADEEQVLGALAYFEREIHRRQAVLAEADVGSITAYREEKSEVMPALLLIIDNFAVFRELFSDAVQRLVLLAREGSPCGIYLLITSSSVNSVNRTLLDYCKQILTLQLNEKNDYASVLGRLNGVLPAAKAGRGTLRRDKNEPLTEFQTAIFGEAAEESRRRKALTEQSEAMAAVWNRPPERHIDDAALPVRAAQPRKRKKIEPETVRTKPPFVRMNPEPYALELTDVSGNRVYLPAEAMTTLSVCGMTQEAVNDAFEQVLLGAAEIENAEWLVFDGEEAPNREFCTRRGMRYADSAEATNRLIEELTQEVIHERNVKNAEYREAYIAAHPTDQAVPEDAFLPHWLPEQKRAVILIRDFVQFFGYLTQTSLEHIAQFSAPPNPLKLHLAFVTGCDYTAFKQKNFGLLPIGQNLIAQAVTVMAVSEPNTMGLIRCENAASGPIADGMARLCSHLGRSFDVRAAKEKRDYE